MIDPIVSLAFSMHSSKGVYALLLGSGLSSAAEIPTGWAVTLDLISRLAIAIGENCESDPETWYRTKFQQEPEYSGILEKLAPTSAERSALLRRYFEATEEEKSDGKKSPTSAHMAIAKLVASGFIRVLITTNFDRILEQALSAEGVEPVVVSSADAAQGATPLAHSPCTLIKLHGDYLDSRFKNTVEELSSYDPRIDALLDQVFDQYGLIVCGWSATWDRALRKAIERTSSRRYTCLWASKGSLSDAASKLTRLREASVIFIESADTLFESLALKIEALETFDSPHPLSTALAVAALKKYVAEDRFRVKLYDLLMSEAVRTTGLFQDTRFVDIRATLSLDGPTFFDAMRVCEEGVQIMVALLTNGFYFGTETQVDLWAKAIVRVADLASSQTSYENALTKLRRYPACILTYASGLAALARKDYKALRLTFFTHTNITNMEGTSKELVVQALLQVDSLDGQVINQFQRTRFITPNSDRLHSLLRESLSPFLVTDEQYDDTFDEFEYLAALVRARQSSKEGGMFFGPVGRFGWRHRHLYMSSRKHVADRLAAEAAELGAFWGPVAGGLFESTTEFESLRERYQKEILAN